MQKICHFCQTIRGCSVNRLEPSGNYKYHRFYIKIFYVVPSMSSVFRKVMKTNSDCFTTRYKLIGFCN